MYIVQYMLFMIRTHYIALPKRMIVYILAELYTMYILTPVSLPNVMLSGKHYALA